MKITINVYQLYISIIFKLNLIAPNNHFFILCFHAILKEKTLSDLVAV